MDLTVCTGLPVALSRRVVSRTHLPSLALSGAVLAVGGAAGAARYPGLLRDGFNSDEAVYAGQAAAIGGFEPYLRLFGIFRAHPLLVHLVIALGYQVTGVNDWLPRVVCASAGVGLALACLGLGWVALGRLGGLAAGLVGALAPYPVTVSRQVLLDGPVAAFVALSMLLVAVWLASGRPRWLYAAAASAALAFLAKETAILLLPAALLFAVLTPRLPLRPRVDLPAAAAVYAAVVSPYPLSLLASGGAHATGGFVVWQLLRRPNHTADFYLTVAPALGFVSLALAAVGLAVGLRRRRAMDVLALCVLGCNLAFFQLWPTKGYSYLAPLVPPLAYLSARGLLAAAGAAHRAVPAVAGLRRWGRVARTRAVAVGALALLAATLAAAGGAARPELVADSEAADVVTAPPNSLAGTGGLPTARPVGAWVRANTPPEAVLVTIGPSFGNVIEFYGLRRALALSVSENPLRRNPTYQAIANPDATIRHHVVQYLVYDRYSASRSPFFARKLLAYAQKYGGVPVYRAGPRGGGRLATVVIFQVHP